MSLSPYTIDVAPCKPDGTREIFLQHHQRACFSTTSREVLRVCLARWPSKPSAEAASHNSDLDAIEAIRAQRTEDAYQALLDTGAVTGAAFGPDEKDASPTETAGEPNSAAHAHDRAVRATEEAPALEEYLCVFHREELQDQHGRFTFVQPQTLCTAYRVADTTGVELVLHGISPRDIAAASSAGGGGGVFLHGRRQNTRAPVGWGSPLEYQGLLYKPALNAWWMGSPLSVKPVYVAVSSFASPAGEMYNGLVGGNTTATSAGTFPACPTHASTTKTCGGGDGPATCVIASPLEVGAVQSAATPFSSPRPGSPVNDGSAAHLEGRTAQGEFDFPRSRSRSPTPHSPPPPQSFPSSASLQWSANNQDPLLPRPQPLPTAANAKSKYVSLDATVLTQLPLYDAQSRSMLAQSLTVVRTAPDELGLAVTTPLYAQDVVLWNWWPHRLRFSRLASNASALSVVASPHPCTTHYLLFLYDAHYSRLRVLRTPDVHTGVGGFELLFSFLYGDLPFVLPCLHSAHPAPIAVCNYPRANCISVYDVVALLETPSPDTAVVQMDLSAYQATHAHCFGDVRLTGKSSEHHQRQSPTTIPRSTTGHAAAHDGDDLNPHEKWKQKERTAKSWAADAVSPATHPIRSLLYHYGSCLVLQYDWPGGAAQVIDAEYEISFTESNRGGAAEGGRSDLRHRRRRRRCEGTISFTVNFPSLTSSQQPLLIFMLEALGAALGPRAAAFLEYELFKEAWQCSCTPEGFADPMRTCAALLKRLCTPSNPVSSQAAPLTDEGEEGRAPAEAPPTEMCMFVDPSTLTLRRIQQALQPTKRVPLIGTIRDSPDSWRGDNAPALTWTTQQAGLALIALHLLFESCRLQEPLWKLLPPLAELNRDLSVQLQWPSYVDFYSAMVSTVPSSPPEATGLVQRSTSFTRCLSEEVLEAHFDFIEPQTAINDSTSSPSQQHIRSPLLSAPRAVGFASGEAPDLFRTLALQAMGSSRSSNSSTAQTAISRSWPLLGGVPDTHPIALANRVALVYREVFGSPASPGVQHSAAAPLTTDGGSEANLPWWGRTCAQLLLHNIPARLIRQVLNTGVAYPLLEAITKGREQAEPSWSALLLDLVGRRDRCPPASLAAQLVSAGRHVVEAAEENAVARQIRVALADDDGVSVRPDFRKTWRDARLDVAQNIFNTVTPISLTGLEDRPEELTGALELLSSRARAMPLGRGMLTMCTQSFKVQDSIPIPPLNLNGRTNDGISIVNKSTEDMMWPIFHNGCAAGLRFLPLPPSFCASGGSAEAPSSSLAEDGSRTLSQRFGAGAAAQSITKQWVMYQTKNIGNAASRAGLLLATGILGHLTVLQRTDIFYLLISRQEQYVWREATTMAVMLGLSCSFCGTSSEAVFRCLSVHVQSLNPSAEDIEVSLDVQTAALVSMGLLCQQAPSNSFLVEVFLVEISRLPTDEHCSKREGYVLGAGFGLGQLLLGVGAAHGVPHVEDRLLAFMNGAPRKSAVSTREGVEYLEETMGRGEAGHFLARALLSQEQREATFNSCASVYEGNCYNIFVSGPAAAVALGMMYLQTDSAFMAAKVAPPNRRIAMQRLTPLLCQLRSMMASLICWSSVAPTREWLYGQLPSSLLELTATNAVPLGLAAQQRNYLLMNLGHCLAGQVMAMGLRYAGTMDTRARDVIFAEMKGFLAGNIGSTTTPIPAVQRVTGAYEACVLACANALSVVMAGTGDLKVFSALRRLYRRTKLSYGSHMAVSMSMGLLFLGSGRLSLSNNIASVAALLMAFYPVWPSDPEDNTHHLQALRHLYGLAVVPRVMEAVDAVSHQPVSVPVHIFLRPAAAGNTSDQQQRNRSNSSTSDREQERAATTGGTDNSRAGHLAECARLREIRTRTPCLYPPAELIERVEIHSPQHYPLVFTPTSTELTRSASMEFRVMAKDSVFSHGSSRVTRSPLESRLLNWLHRLFHQPSTTTAEALTMLESVKLMHQVQRRLVATALAGETLLNSDLSAAVKAAMEKRYSYIFLHRAENTTRTAQAPEPQHPLYELLVEGHSRERVVQNIAAHPHGTAAFPCDFTSLIAPSGASRYHGDCEDDAVADRLDIAALHRWITESLQYYGLKPLEQQRIRDAFAAVGMKSAASPVLASSVARLSCLLKLQAATQLPLSTLEKVWACCVS